MKLFPTGTFFGVNPTFTWFTYIYANKITLNRLSKECFKNCILSCLNILLTNCGIPIFHEVANFLFPVSFFLFLVE